MVHHACALSLVNVFEYCIYDMSNETTIDVIYNPLEETISGGKNLMAQIGSAHCLYEFFNHLKINDNLELLNLLLPKYRTLFIVN